MSQIELRPHGPSSFTVTIDGKRHPVFWSVEELGEDRFRFVPVFAVGGHQPFELQGELVRQPRRAQYVFWEGGEIKEVMVNVQGNI
ncbi:hypothetical protein EHF33_14225 [Deinococcus psychrotolerans]|uniref:Uncharacterized protein n=1 Tax=Deinococcus psychrotolerans TaxID=2489213 RepID=A0A3G8YQU4_9DEIO|nr:hypothetical protein [Deinococcus psychrotolerans]AZI44071.1 hypothetical protein EHF33_14225 [Deinococcus psychrotolerans]